MSRAYFFAFPGICVARLWPSCFDLAWAALSALAAFFCFWSRCFDLGDLSPTGSSISLVQAIEHTIAVASSKGKRNARRDDAVRENVADPDVASGQVDAGADRDQTPMRARLQPRSATTVGHLGPFPRVLGADSERGAPWKSWRRSSSEVSRS